MALRNFRHRAPKRVRKPVYLARVNATGGAVLLGTYLGSGGNTTLAGLDVAADGTVTLSGTTTASSLPVSPGAAQPRLMGHQNAFVARFDASGQLTVCSYLGGSQFDQAVGVSADAAGNIYVAGIAESPDFPIVGGLPAVQTAVQNAPGFAAKFSPDGRSLLYSTRLAIRPLAAAGGSEGTLTILSPEDATSLGSQLDRQERFSVGDLFLPVDEVDPTIAALAVDAAGNTYLAGTQFVVPDLTPLYVMGTPGVFQPGPAGGVDATVMKPALTAARFR